MLFLKLLIISLFFYFLALLQTSFLIHFGISGFYLNIILFIAVLWNFIEKPSKYDGIYIAFIAGFFLDMISGHFFGFWVSILGFTSLFIKLVIRKYVWIPFLDKS